MSDERPIASFRRLLGQWSTVATHPEMPGVTVHGTMAVEWLEGERFLVVRARTDHPQFPDSLVVIGDMTRNRADEQDAARVDRRSRPSTIQMHYFDSRGVFRDFETRMTDGVWEYWREVAGFPQRFTGRFADGDRTIVGLVQLRDDLGQWVDDLAITYHRVIG